jgi:hypothetical protein
MQVNAKMIPVETIQGIEGGEQRRTVEGINSSVIYLVCCKKLCKCHNVPSPTTTIKEKIKDKKKKSELKEYKNICEL